MTALFQTILSRSLSASWVVLAVISARFLLKKAPKWVNCALWALVALRLVCPISIESPFSLVPSQDTLLEEVAVHVSAPAAPEAPAYAPEKAAVPQEPAAAPYIPSPAPKTHAAETETSQWNWLAISTGVWLLGVLALSAYALVSACRIRQKVGACIDLGNGVFLCDYIDTPFILGVIHPKIYLPSAMDPRDAAHVLAHEKAHLARRDHWWKPLGYTLLALHWFNPRLWLAYSLLCRDIELACDEKVIKDLAGPEKKSYSEALLKCSVQRSTIAACPLAFGEVGVKQRIRSILHYKKPGFWILLVSILALVVLALGFLTDPQQPTLASMLDIGEDVVCVDVWGRKGLLCYEAVEELDWFLELLDTMEYDPEPIQDEPILGDADENGWSYWLLRIHRDKDFTEAEGYLMADYDYTMVWTRDAEGNTSLPYRLKNPEALQSFLQDYATPVLNRIVTEVKEGDLTDPAAWLRHVREESIKNARCITHDGKNLEVERLSMRQLSQAVSILNAIPAFSLGAGEAVTKQTFQNMRYYNNGYGRPLWYAGSSLILEDAAWNMTAIVRHYEDRTELLLLRDFSWNSRDPLDTDPGYGWIWRVDSQELADCLSEIAQRPANISTFAGSRYAFNRESIQLTDGSHSLHAITLVNWDYEIIYPHEGEGSFGFRCRPKEESEGWVYFGWWGNNFSTLSDAEYWNKNQFSYNSIQDTEGTKYYLLPQANTWNEELYLQGEYMPWIYKRYACKHGDFIILNQDADAWVKEYEEDLGYIRMFITQTCKETESQG